MMYNANDDTPEQQSLPSTDVSPGSDTQSSYDAAFDFLYSEVPFGEYPETTAADISSEAAKNQSE